MDNTNQTLKKIQALMVGKKDDDVPSVPQNWKPTPVKRNSVDLTRTQIIDALDQLEKIYRETINNNISLRIVLRAQERCGLLSEKQAIWLERQIKWHGI